MDTSLRWVMGTGGVALWALAHLAGCAREQAPAPTERGPTVSMLELVDQDGAVPTDVQGVEFTLSTPQRRGVVDFYRLIGTDLKKLERVPFEQAPLRSFVRYSAPATTAQSVLLAHVSTLGDAQPDGAEYVCMARIAHTGNRNHVALDCDLLSTISFYMAAERIGASGSAPFADVAERLDRWQALYAARDNDLIAFLVSAFGTLQRALIDMGGGRFNPAGQSIRPVMESVVAQALEQYQRNGQLSGTQLVQIADEVTGGSLPLVRLTRFPEVYESVAHVEPITLTDPKGHLTRRDRVADPPTLQAELQRFFLRGAPLELSDPRTHVPQGVRHVRRDDSLVVEWQPLPHMDGYNLYLQGEFLRTTRQPRVELPASTAGTLMIRAVGYAGEHVGHRHPLADEPTEEPPT